MPVPSIQIVITDKTTGKFLVIKSVNQVNIESSWQTLTNTAKITLPRSVRILNGNINNIVKRGSFVTIDIAYNGNFNLEFTGYVARLDAKIPFVIYCEDEMWQLKQTKFTGSFSNIKLKDLIKYIYPGQANVVDFTLPNYRISQWTGAKVLANLKDTYGFYSYFENGILNVGFAYDLALKKQVIFHLQRNIPENGIKLEYRLKEDYKVRVKGTSKLPGGNVITYTASNTQDGKFGVPGADFDGDTKNMNFVDMPGDQLKLIVDNEIKQYKISGYQGYFSAFGVPYCQHGDIAHLIDRLYPEREGIYYIDKTEVNYSMEGFRREIYLGRRAGLVDNDFLK